MKRSAFQRLQRLLTIGLIGAIAVFGLAWFFKGSLPRVSEILPELEQEPVQKKTTRKKFSFTYRGVSYNVTPVAGYELWGLVVAHNNIGSLADIYHDDNSVDVKDICVIWGDNVQRDDFRRVKFRGDCYVCYFKYPSGVSFDHYQLANNHLLSSDPAVLRRIAAVQVGDQVHLEGLLVNYSPEGANWTRKTSTTRKDSEMGACEVVFVENLEILRPGTPGCYAAYRLGKIFILAFLAAKILLLILKAVHDQRAFQRARRSASG